MKKERKIGKEKRRSRKISLPLIIGVSAALENKTEAR